MMAYLRILPFAIALWVSALAIPLAGFALCGVVVGVVWRPEWMQNAAKFSVAGIVAIAINIGIFVLARQIVQR